MNFHKFYMLLEGKSEELISSNPELQDAYSRGIKNSNYLSWLLRVKGDEPVRDIVPTLLSFERNKQKLIKKDLLAYKSVGELRDALEGASKSKEQKNIESMNSETTFLGKFGDWYAVMPHTVESSCHWGKGTTWCTAYTQSGNMFLHYSAFERITLFYLIKEGSNPRIDPNSKLSVGFKDGKIDYENSSTVNSANQILDESSLRSILGDQYGLVMNALKKQVMIIGDKHPSRNLIKSVASGDVLPAELEERFSPKEGYTPQILIRGIAQYDLTLDGVYEIVRHFMVFGGYEETVQELITYSKDHFETAKLLIEYFRSDPSRIEGKYVSIILRFGSVFRMNDNDLKVGLDRMEELMKLLGSKNLYLLDSSEVKELFDIASSHGIKFSGVKEGQTAVDKLSEMLSKYAPELVKK